MKISKVIFTLLFLLSFSLWYGLLNDDANPFITQITYYKHIQPIFQKSCMPCHSSRGIAHYFPLDSFEVLLKNRKKAFRWIDKGIMPPWRADGDRHQFLNDIRPTRYQKKLIKAWVDNPLKGSAQNAAPPPPPVNYDKSQILELELEREVNLPPGESLNLFVYLKNPNFGKDVFLIKDLAFEELSPYIHHLIIYIIPRDIGKPVLEAYNKTNKKGIVYGEFNVLDRDIKVVHISSLAFPGENMGIRIPGDHDFIIDIHYETTFSTESLRDKAKFKLLIADQVEHELVAPDLSVNWSDIKIPLGDPHYKVSDTHTLNELFIENKLTHIAKDPKRTYEVVGFLPHMHDFGKKLNIHWGPQSKLIFTTVQWDTIFSFPFWLKNRFTVSGEDKFTIDCIYDASPNNPYVKDLPEGTDFIYAGPTSSDEMCNSFLFLMAK